MQLTRRDIGKIALASVPLAKAFGAKRIDSKFGGVQVGAITYSFNRIASPDPEAIIKAYVDIGLGEAELMSNHCEALAGAPAMPAFGRGGGGARTSGSSCRGRPPPAGGPPAGGSRRGRGRRTGRRPGATHPGAAGRAAGGHGEARRVAQVDRRRTPGRRSPRSSTMPASMSQLLCYNMQDSMKDEDIEYGFAMAKGARRQRHHHQHHAHDGEAHRARSPTQHKLLVGYHGHDATNDPNQTATLESYATLMALRQVQRRQSGHRPLHGRRTTTRSRSSRSTTPRSPTCTSRIARRTTAPTSPYGARATRRSKTCCNFSRRKSTTSRRTWSWNTRFRRIPTSLPRPRSASRTSRVVWCSAEG